MKWKIIETREYYLENIIQKKINMKHMLYKIILLVMKKEIKGHISMLDL